MGHPDEDDLPVAYCVACWRAIYRDQEAAYLDGDWYCDLACLAHGLGAKVGPADEILEQVAPGR